MASGMFPYNTTTHINVLEMKATLMALQHDFTSHHITFISVIFKLNRPKEIAASTSRVERWGSSCS